MIAEKDVRLLESAFKKYYFDHFDLIRVPERTREREFGYQRFNSGMIRHISLKDDKELRMVLMNSIPSDVYCSNGYYSFPNLPMAEKDWKEADLIFDIDAKDLNLDCRHKHTCSRCSECGIVFGDSPTCPDCNSNKIESRSFTCGDCISAAKKEAAKLSKILTDDLGISKQNILVYFSGNEGFHIHIPNSGYQEPGSKERSELAGYVMFKNIIPETLGMTKNRPDRRNFPELDESGWRGRAAAQIFGPKSRRSKAISQILAGGYPSCQNTLLEIAPKIGAVIDPNVTTDIHRIFRLSGTLNSKSGLAKMYCDDLGDFDPYSDACLIDDGETEVLADCPVQFTLKHKKFGPYKSERVRVPRYAAAYLICKGFAATA